MTHTRKAAAIASHPAPTTDPGPASLRNWGAAASLIGGVTFATGHLLAWLGTAPDAWSVTGAWLNLAAVAALVVAVIGVHEALARTGTPWVTVASVLSVVGFALLVGFFTLRLALAYGHITAEVTETPALAGLSAVSNGLLLLGLALLAAAIHRSRRLGRVAGPGLALSVAAFATGFVLPLGGLIGGLLLGASFTVIATHLHQLRPPHQRHGTTRR